MPFFMPGYEWLIMLAMLAIINACLKKQALN